MQIINHLPKSYSEEASYFNSGEFISDSTDGKIRLKYTYGTDFAPDETAGTLGINLSDDFTRLSSGKIAINPGGNSFVGVYVYDPNGQPPIQPGHLNIVKITSNTSVTINLPDPDTLEPGTEYEFFMENTDNNNGIYTGAKLYISTGSSSIKIYTTGDTQRGDKIVSNTSFALIGLKYIRTTTSKYWIASGNCSIA